MALIILPERSPLVMHETADVGWVLSQIMAVSLTLTVLRKSQHPSHGSFTDVIDPHWSVSDFVSLWQKYSHNDTLGFRDTHTMQGQTTKGSVAIQAASRRHAAHFWHKQEVHFRQSGTWAHSVLLLLVLQGFNFPFPDVARALIHSPVWGSPLRFSSVSPGKAED